MKQIVTTSLQVSFAVPMLLSGAQAALIAHYKFDEGSGASTAVNEVVGGAGYDATVMGAVTTGVTGIAGNAYQFNGTGANHVILNNPAFASAITGSGAMTFSAWIKKPTDVSANGILALGNINSNDNYYQLSSAVGLGRVTNRSGDINALFGYARTDDNVWHHVVGTIAHTGGNTTMQLYVDGDFESTLTEANGGPNALNVLSIGVLARNTSSLNDPFDGLIDDVQIYDEVLSATQISYLYNNAGQAIPEPSVAVLSLGVLGLLARRRR
ncbi:MAG: LamG domain-containing protein [Verrucomicrobiales bacterium]